MHLQRLYWIELKLNSYRCLCPGRSEFWASCYPIHMCRVLIQLSLILLLLITQVLKSILLTQMVVILSFSKTQRSQILFKHSMCKIPFHTNNKWWWCTFKVYNWYPGFWRATGILKCVAPFSNFFLINITEHCNLFPVLHCQWLEEETSLSSCIPDGEWLPLT